MIDYSVVISLECSL